MGDKYNSSLLFQSMSLMFYYAYWRINSKKILCLNNRLMKSILEPISTTQKIVQPTIWCPLVNQAHCNEIQVFFPFHYLILGSCVLTRYLLLSH